MLVAAAAQTGGMMDLLTNTFSKGTATQSGHDDSGPWVLTVDTTGAGAVPFTINSATMNYHSWAVIFKMMGAGNRGWPLSMAVNSGVLIINTSIAYDLGNGTWWTATSTAIPGHTYFAFATNIVGTASLFRFGILIDLTTGQVWTNRVASTGGFPLTPAAAISQQSTFVSNERVYAMFVGGSPTPIPPAVQPGPGLPGVDVFNAIQADPWGLWYG